MLTDAMDPRYVPMTGHLLFVRQGVLMAVGFDPERLEVQGEPVAMVEGIMHALFAPNTLHETGAAQVAVSASGDLAYVLGGLFPPTRRAAVRLSSGGESEPLRMDTLELDELDYNHFRLSPDGTRLTFAAGTGRQSDIGVHDLVRGVSQGLNAGGFGNHGPIWSPDGRWLAFSSDRDVSVLNMYRIAADGSGSPERLAPSNRAQTVTSWSAQGVIAFLTGGDIWLLPSDRDPHPFFRSEDNERAAAFSPNSRWLAYESNRSGRFEVYVRPYPGPEPATQISGDGGRNPIWSLDGRRIYYTSPDGQRVVEVGEAEGFEAGRPTPVLQPWAGGFRSPAPASDITADDSFIIAMEIRDPAQDGSDLDSTLSPRRRATQIHVVLNFAEELRERVPN